MDFFYSHTMHIHSTIYFYSQMPKVSNKATESLVNVKISLVKLIQQLSIKVKQEVGELGSCLHLFKK